MNASLAGKVALVTGAGKNIGRAIAMRLAADGAAIVVNGRSDEGAIKAVADEIIAGGGRAMAYRADITKPEEVAAMAAAVAAQLRQLRLPAVLRAAGHGRALQRGERRRAVAARAPFVPGPGRTCRAGLGVALHLRTSPCVVVGS